VAISSQSAISTTSTDMTTLRKVDGWQTIGQPIAERVVDLAA
jgi:hypothetical protein